MLSAYLVFVAVFSLWLGFIWKSNNLLNSVLKVVFYLQALFGAIFAAADFGLVITV